MAQYTRLVSQSLVINLVTNQTQQQGQLSKSQNLLHQNLPRQRLKLGAVSGALCLKTIQFCCLTQAQILILTAGLALTADLVSGYLQSNNFYATYHRTRWPPQRWKIYSF